MRHGSPMLPSQLAELAPFGSKRPFQRRLVYRAPCKALPPAIQPTARGQHCIDGGAGVHANEASLPTWLDCVWIRVRLARVEREQAAERAFREESQPMRRGEEQRRIHVDGSPPRFAHLAGGDEAMRRQVCVREDPTNEIDIFKHDVEN